MIAIIDYGMGNLRSAEKALERVGAEVTRATEPEAAADAAGLVLPGVGAFPEAMRRIRRAGFEGLITDRVGAGTPLLGICLGMQLLFDRSSEGEGAEGLGLLPGDVAPLRADGLKVPHIGWSPVRWERQAGVTAGLSPEPPFYFVHSYAPVPEEADHVLGTAAYGERFASAVAAGDVTGFQFHPEKSSADGLALLRNFVRICEPR